MCLNLKTITIYQMLAKIMRKKILITGGTGLVGTVLTQKLLEKGYEVVFLSRTAGITKQGIKKYTWDFSKKEIDITAFEGVSVLIHLAGTSVASKRWSSSHKKDIYESRIDATRFLVETIQQHNISLDAVLCASATGIYGMSLTDELMTEESQNATDFLAKVTIDWEKEIDKFKS